MLRGGVEPNEWTYRPKIKLYSKAPVVLGEDLQLREMQFSLKPPGAKYATFNARLFDFDEKKNKVISINDKWTWKKPIQESRCLIPMTGFVEPIYTGAHAGEMVEFEDKVLDMVFAAGIYEVSKDTSGKPYEGFSIIMDQAHPFVKETGHHRTPVFLKQTSFEQWLSSDLEADEAIQLLIKNKQELDLKVRTERKMAEGWEKRVAKNIKDAKWEEEFEALRKSKKGS